MTKKNTQERHEFLFLFIIILTTLLFSRINIPVINSFQIMPDYFIALFVSLIASRFMNLNLYILFVLGLLVDLLAGELMGQYALILIFIYFINFLLSKYFIFKTPVMLASQHIILATISLIILLISSISYDLSINTNMFIMKWVITCLVCLLYSKLIQFLRNKI